MNIYPYVYRLDHPVTGEFYIGVRLANKVPAEQDLGHNYFTSSKTVKPRFHEFNFQILAEFFNRDDAYWFEQSSISENWGDPKMANKCVHRRHSDKLHFIKESIIYDYTCPQCGKPFSSNIKSRRFCSNSCVGKNNATINKGKSQPAMSNEVKAKMSAHHWSKNGGTHGMLGKHQSTESIINSIKHRKNSRIWCAVSPDGEVYSTYRILEFTIEHKLNLDAIKKYAKRKVLIPKSRPQDIFKTGESRLNSAGWFFIAIPSTSSVESLEAYLPEEQKDYLSRLWEQMSLS